MVHLEDLDNLIFISSLYVQIITQSDFLANPFCGFRHTQSRKSPLFSAISLRPELPYFITIIQMSYPFVMQLIIHMFHASLISCMSLDQYLNPNLYTIPNMQNMRFFCCSVYINNQIQSIREVEISCLI